jgi:hypothetical protein
MHIAQRIGFDPASWTRSASVTLGITDNGRFQQCDDTEIQDVWSDSFGCVGVPFIVISGLIEFLRSKCISPNVSTTRVRELTMTLSSSVYRGLILRLDRAPPTAQLGS